MDLNTQPGGFQRSFSNPCVCDEVLYQLAKIRQQRTLRTSKIILTV